MHIVIPRFSSLDPGAGKAVQAVATFDAAVESCTDAESILVLAASTAGIPARIVDPVHDLDVRADPAGTITRPAPTDPDTDWMCVPLGDDNSASVWLERSLDDMTLLDGLVLDRTIVAIRSRQRRPRRVGETDVATATAVLLNSGATESERATAIRALRLRPDGKARVAVSAISLPRIEAEPDGQTQADRDTVPPALRGQRTGIGPYVTHDQLAASHQSAQLALAFAADDSDHDPGPTTVYSSDLGALHALAAGLDAGGAPPPDVATLDAASMTGPWALRTLVALVSNSSARLAAAALFVHHSTFQDRIATLEHVLNWHIREPNGQFRLQLALASRRYLLHPRNEA